MSRLPVSLGPWERSIGLARRLRGRELARHSSWEVGDAEGLVRDERRQSPGRERGRDCRLLLICYKMVVSR